MTTPLNLPAMVRDILDTTDLRSPEEIAQHLTTQLTPTQLAELFPDVAREYVRHQIGLHRMRLVNQATGTPSSYSAKVAAIRASRTGLPDDDAWMRERVYVGEYGWLLLRECGYDHLKILEEQRLANAERSIMAAERYGRLAELLRRHQVATVGELPVVARAAVFGLVEAPVVEVPVEAA